MAGPAYLTKTAAGFRGMIQRSGFFCRFVGIIAESNMDIAVRLSRPWLVVECLSLAFTQAIATAVGLSRASCPPPFGPEPSALCKIAPGDFIAPGLLSAIRVHSHDPRSLLDHQVKYAG